MVRYNQSKASHRYRLPARLLHFVSFKKKGFPDFRDRNLISIFQHNHEVIRVDTRQDYNRLKRELDASGIVRRLVLSGMGGFGGWMISVVMSRGYGKIKSISKKLEI